MKPIKQLTLIFFLAVSVFAPPALPKDWRWNNPNDFGKSLNPGRKHLIEIVPGLYRPGSMPQGIGERLKQFRLVADEY